jgi:FkbM family methyltransferase
MRDFLKLGAIAATTRLALLVREPVRFWLRVALRTSRIGRYRLRGSEVVVYLRHGTVDIMTFEEIFSLGHYELPPQVVETLRNVESPLRIVDLGANIGLFGAYIRRLFPDARITGFEPHPANVEVLKRTIQANGGQGGWRLVEACADVRDGTVPFALSEFTTSRVESSSAQGGTVPAVDVFPFLDDADLLKIDIEGAEWRVLTDPRFRPGAARAIALEYHPYGCPDPDPGTFARRLLEQAGYETHASDFRLPPSHGMLWAWHRA